MWAFRYIMGVVIRAVLMIIGIPGNGLIIVVYYRKQRKTGTDVFILGLAIVDFIVCLTLPLKIYSSVTSQFTNDVLCKLMSFIIYWNTYVGMFLTAVITVDRYIAVCRPLKRRVSPKYAAIIILTCTVSAAVCAIPSLPRTGIRSYGPSVSKCSHSWELALAYAQVITHVNDALLYSCLVLIATLYILIWISVRRQARVRAIKLGGISSVCGQVRPTHISVVLSEAWAGDNANKAKVRMPSHPAAEAVDKTSGSAPGASRYPLTGESNGSNRHLSVEQATGRVIPTDNRSTQSIAAGPNSANQPTKAKAAIPSVRTSKKTTIMIFITTVIFFLTWIPANIWTYYVKYTWVQTDPVVYNIYYLSFLSVHLNQVLNPFIYSFVNIQFRRECITVMRQIRQCRL